MTKMTERVAAIERERVVKQNRHAAVAAAMQDVLDYHGTYPDIDEAADELLDALNLRGYKVVVK